MAIIFELYLEMNDPNETLVMMNFWEDYSTTLRSSEEITWIISQDSKLHLTIWSKELGLSGIQSYEHATKLTECGIDLLKYLTKAPDFALARIGIEVDGYCKDDFVKEHQDGDTWIPEGTILDKKLWQELGSPILEEFRSGYYWKRYMGEVANPIMLDVELNKKWGSIT